ncbi:MAG TPA: TolC family protein, partial [Thermodesulfovibrionales bacterium]|nr:TolC family protein [Thermodesulfovibrionales bacterium]
MAHRAWRIGLHLKDMLPALCSMRCAVFLYGLFFIVVANQSSAADNELRLQDLVNEALANNHEVHIAGYRLEAAGYRVPQAKSLPDPMFMFGYQNEGWKSYSFGKMPDAQWMFSASQMLPFPGKLALKGEMASSEAEGLKEFELAARLKTVERVKELFFDLLFAHKSLELFRERSALFSRIEDAALARYSSGMGPQQEVLMAQTEKYMLAEKEEMLKQKVQSIETMLNATLGRRDVKAPLGKPEVPPHTVIVETLEQLLSIHVDNSPFVKEKEKMAAAADAKVRMAEREYYPDFTLNAGYFNRGGGQFMDMWSLTTTINIPIFYRTKQKQAVLEAKTLLSQARHEVLAAKSMLSSAIRDNYSMAKTAERLMALYREGLIPKAYQDYEAAIAGYMNGKIEAITAISRLKALLDFETSYWGQYSE